MLAQGDKPKSKNNKRKTLARLLNQHDVSSAKGYLSGDSSEFEMGEKNLFVCLNQARKVNFSPPVSLNPYFAKDDPIQGDKSGESNQINLKLDALVAILRDIDNLVEPDINNYSPSRALKEKLLKSKIKSYTISVPNLLKDLQAVQAMKGYTRQIPNNNSSNEYIRLILAILTQKMTTKRNVVIIVNLGDESIVKLGPLRDFCIQSNAEVYTLDHVPNESLDSQLEKISDKLATRLKHIKQPEASKRSISAEKLAQNSNNPTQLPESKEDKLDINANKIISEDKTHQANNSESTPTAIELETEEPCGYPNTIDQTDSTSMTESEQTGNTATSTRNSDTQSKNEKVVTKPKKRFRRIIITDAAMQCESRHFGLTRRPDVDVTTSMSTPFDTADSVESLHLSELFAQRRPKLLQIHVMPDESAYPSAIFTKFPNTLTKRQSNDENDVYKGWVAVPTNIEDSIQGKTQSFHSRIVSRLASNVKGVGDTILRRVFRPIGRFFSCEVCRKENKTRVTPLRQDYPGILLDSDAFDQKPGN